MAKNREKGNKPISSPAEKKNLWVAQERAKKENFLIQSKKLSADIEKARAEKKKKEIEELQAAAAVENDIEFTKNENHYFRAVKDMGYLLDFIKEHSLENLEKSKEKDIEDLVDLSLELKKLLDERNYTKFAEDYAIFSSALEELDLQVKEELKLAKINPGPEKKEEAVSDKDISDADIAKLEASLGVGKEKPKKEKPAKEAVPAQAEKLKGISLEDAEADWGLLEEIGVKLLSKEKRQETEELTKRINQILHLAGKADRANFHSEVEAQMVGFEHTFKELLSKIPTEIKKEFKSQLAGNAPSWEKDNEKEAAPVVEKPVEEKKEDAQERYDFIKEKKTKLKLLERVLRQYFHKKDHNYNFNETPSSLWIDASLELLNKAEQNLLANNKDAYEQNIEEAQKITNKLWESDPVKQTKKEYYDRSNGKETEGVKKEREENEIRIKELENSFILFTRIIDEKHGNPSVFAAEFKIIRDNLFEALGNLYNPDACEENISKAEIVFGQLTMKVESEIKNAYYAKLAGEKQKASVKESVVAGEIPDKGMVVEKTIKAESRVEISPDMPHESVEPKKKGLWSRFKEAIFHSETKKVAKKVGYDTVTSVLGIKLITDALYAIKGKGDIAEWWKGRKESKNTKDAITIAYQDLIASFTKVKENKVLEEYEKIENRIANFKAKVESAHISPEDKKALLDRVWVISMKHEQDSKATVEDRNKQIDRALDSYVQGKISGIKIARDAMNFALTASGMAMLRGLMYAGASMAERAGKARKEFAKKTPSASDKEKELKFVAKDVFVNSAIETARALTGRGDKAGTGGVKRTVDFIKALGTIARGFGIYGLAISGTTVHEQVIDKFLGQIKEQGVASTVSKNFAEHMERVWETYTNPTNVFGGNKEPEKPEIPNTPEQPPVVEHHEIQPPVEAPATFSMDQFAQEHKLSSEFSNSLGNLLKEHPELNNEESVQNILKATQIGPDAHSHHGTIIKGTIDTLDESGGERRQVIFEEILKHGGPKAAADYLQSQHFSSQHLSHLSGFIRKGAPDEFLKFAEKYNNSDPRMVGGLFQAMQGRESTDLANARLEVDAGGANGAIDNHVRGKVSYFGLENNKPVLSGTGSVTVDQMGVRGAIVNEKSIEERINDNATKIRSIQQESSAENLPAPAKVQMPPDMTDAEKQVWEENKRFAALGEQHVRVLDKVRGGTTDAEGKYHAEAIGPALAAPAEQGTKEPQVYVEKTVKTFKASESAPVVETKVPEAKPIVAEVEKTPVVEKAPVAPEPYVDAPINKFLKEHGSNQKEFFDTFEKMRVAIATNLDSSLIRTEGSDKFLQEKINYLYESQENYKSALQNGTAVSKTDLGQIKKLIHAEELYKNGKSEWVENLDKAVFNKDDNKVMQLAFAEHKDADANPILTNNSHAVRIWDSAKKKDVFWYDQDSTFSLDKKGNLLIKNDSGQQVMAKEEALRIARE